MRLVAVLVGTRIDPVSGRATRSAADAAAVQLALQIAPDPRVLTAGDMHEHVAREYLALGVSLIECVGGPMSAAAALAKAAAGATLVLAGARGEGGIGSGLTPYEVAAAIGCPLVADVIDVQADGDAWLLTQALARGARRRLRVRGATVATLSPRAPAAARHSYDAAQRGRIERAPDLAVAPSPLNAAWRMEPRQRQLRPLAAQDRHSGHARMALAVGSGPVAQAGIVVKEGSVDEKARALLNHLRVHALIDF
jgi:electron transfer flavoprotein beta subunit